MPFGQTYFIAKISVFLSNYNILSMKKKVVAMFLVILLLYGEKSFSQENRYIQISATDTLELKPLKFTYQINVQNSSLPNIDQSISRKINSDTTQPNQFRRNLNTVSVKQILEILETNHFHYSIYEENNFSITTYNRNNDSTLIVTMNSENELKQLYHLLITLPNINSHISNIEYEHVSDNQSDIFNRLYLRAKKQAETIALVSSNSLGQLISVEEEKNMIGD
jgi:hypothetical protein